MQLNEIHTPAYVADIPRLRRNLEILREVSRESGAHILLAQKAFSMFSLYPMMGEYLDGTTASGLYEARLGKEEMGRENHVFSPAYRTSEIDALADCCDHIVFNSLSQLRRFQDRVKGRCSIGLRVNPECSTQEGHEIYDPCAPHSRLGVTLSALQEGLKKDPNVLKNVEGLHFHTLCEQNSDALEETLAAVEAKFGFLLPRLRWLNMGGGHHITRADYDRERLIRCVRYIREKYHLTVYLEPGEAVALNAGYLVTEVLDRVENDGTILLLDASAACHMPDVLEMPYRPPLRDSGLPGEKPYTYRLSSCTCLAGDLIGEYSFDREIRDGERLIFEDMAIYTMVKNNTFNGMPLPWIYVMDEDGDCRLIRRFGYQDFKERLS